MKIISNYEVSTGNIVIAEGEKGLPLEFLSIGDYGKEKNVKADFLGLPNEINGVPHGALLPLEEKWVVTISSQYGCSMNCTFCDVPKVGKGINVTLDDLVNQVEEAIALHPEVTYTKRLNLHYARMGEPTWNWAVINSAELLAEKLKAKGFGFHPVVSTMMPKNNKDLADYLYYWLSLKNRLDGEAGLQLSINTTDDHVRGYTMPHALPLNDIGKIMRRVISMVKGEIKGRKITLNFALTEAAIDAVRVRELFDPEYFICKITPMHKTVACVDNHLLTENGYDYFYPYKEVEEALKKEGFDVIVFIPSHEEDSSRITCGNALLAGKAMEGVEKHESD